MAFNEPTSINLLHGRSEELKKQRVNFAKVQFVSVVVLIGYLALVAAVLAIHGVIALRISQVSEAIKKEELAIAQLKPIEERYVLVMNKLQLLEDIFKNKGFAREALVNIYTSLPAGVLVSGIESGKEGNSIRITARAGSMTSIIAYLNLVQQLAVDKAYKSIALNGLSRDKDGSYAISAVYALEK